jgi:GNAT superfamily N-acetyltransferase
MQPPVSLQTVTGQALHAHQPPLAVLRVAVFREWPYLYAGDDAFERRYLARYAATPSAAMVLAMAEGAIVGASTCLPLAAETPNVRAPFEAAGWPVERVCYFGESVLLRPYRGLGIGVKFFAAREAHAASIGLDLCTFCSVIRPEDHPLRPADHVKLDEFWRHRGYTPRPDLVCTMRWQDVDQDVETDKQLSFWVKSLSGAALP